MCVCLPSSHKVCGVASCQAERNNWLCIDFTASHPHTPGQQCVCVGVHFHSDAPKAEVQYCMCTRRFRDHKPEAQILKMKDRYEPWLWQNEREIEEKQWHTHFLSHTQIHTKHTHTHTGNSLTTSGDVVWFSFSYDIFHREMKKENLIYIK